MSRNIRGGAAHSRFQIGRGLATLAAGVVVAAMGVSRVWAADYHWINSSGGTFTVSTNWAPFDPSPPPPVFLGPGGGSDTVHFTLGMTPQDRYAVTGVTGQNYRMLIENDSLSLDFSDDYSLEAVPGDASFVVGANDGDVADVILTGSGGAIFSPQRTHIGESGGSSGSITVRGSGWQWIGGQIMVGWSGTGTLTIEDGGSVTSAPPLIGALANSTGTAIVRGHGSSWTSGGGFQVALGMGTATGTVIVEDGGSIASSSGVIGNGGSATMIVRNADSSWTVDQTLFVAYNGTTALNIEGGASASAGTAWIGGWADEGFGTGIVTIRDPGSTWIIEEDLTVGVSGAGTLRAENGGRVSSGIGWIGFNAGSIGAVNVSGARATWTNSGDLFVGNNGDGSLTVEDGGSVSNSTGWIGAGASSSGAVIVRGVRSQWTNNGELFVGNEGTGSLTIEAGGAVSNSGVWIGTSPGSSGIATVRGAGSTWTSDGQFIIGYRAAGSLMIESGGSVTNTGSSIIGFTPSAGLDTLAIITGEGSTWTNNGNLIVGNSGFGTLSIEAGGDVWNTDGFIANHPGAKGMATVNGAGSTWTHTGSLYVGGSDAQAGGDGMLNVSDGAVVSVAGALHIWNTGTVTGDGTVDGNVVNAGLISPGNSVGALSIFGDYTADAAGMLATELGGTGAGQSDQLLITGSASLAGTLAVSLIDGFVALPGMQFKVMTFGSRSGEFGAMLSNTGFAGLWFDTTYTSTSLTLTAAALEGDANLDGVVSIADLGILAANWQEDGQNWLTADFNGDGSVTIADLGVLAGNWQAGTNGESSVTFADAMAMFNAFDGVVVPEPGSLSLLSLAGLLALRRRRLTCDSPTIPGAA